MQHFNSISKNLIFLVVIAILPALVILLYTGIEQRRNSVTTAKLEVQRLAASIAQIQQGITDSSRQILSTLALLPDIQTINIAACSKIFTAVLVENPDLHNIVLTDPEGTVLAAGKNFKKIALNDRKHIRDVQATKQFSAGEYVETRLGITQGLPFTFPVLDKKKQLKGILILAIDLQRLKRLYDKAAVPPNTFIAASDHQGIRLFHYPQDDATYPPGQPINTSLWQRAENSRSAEIFTDSGADGTTWIFAVEPLRLDPQQEPYIYLWTGTPEAPALASANAVLQRNLLLILLATALALLSARILGRSRLIAPIQELIEITNRFATGKLVVRNEKTPQIHELKTLSDAFYTMADRLILQQKNVQESEARFRLIMDSLDALVYVADMDSYEILFINQHARLKFGDITGKLCWQQLQHGQTGPCDFCTNKYLLGPDGQPGEIYTWEHKNPITDQWYNISDRAIRWIDGRIVRLEIATDISERKKVENRLAEERERLAVTLRSIGDGVITTDTEDRVMLINRVAEVITGWRKEEAIGLRLTEVFHITDEKSKRRLNDPVKTLLAGNEIGQNNHFTMIDKQGREKQISGSSAPIHDQDSKTIGSVLVFRDVTNLLRTEQELTKIEKLKSIGVLAGGIAHDFNNILAAILGNLDLTLRDNSLSENSRRRLKQTQTASFRAIDLTQQLLTFAKGGQPIKETASLAEVVKESAEFSLRGGTVACHYAFPDDLWLVDIDKGQISQVIQNLIINASNAMPDGGTIEISGQNINVPDPSCNQITGADHYVKLEINDSGTGIPDNILDKIFDPYFSTKQHGSGLGLAISHSIISKHSGSISVQSTPGVGSRFSICLPVSRQDSLPEEVLAETVTSKQKARILIMDDEQIVRNIVGEILGEMGHEVLFAKDGREALQIYQQARTDHQSVDLTIMDLTIPGGMGGKEAVQQLLAIDKEARVIVSSGYSNDPVMANFTDYGFCAAITKPYQLDDLAGVIQQLLG